MMVYIFIHTGHGKYKIKKATELLICAEDEQSSKF